VVVERTVSKEMRKVISGTPKNRNSKRCQHLPATPYPEPETWNPEPYRVFFNTGFWVGDLVDEIDELALPQLDADLLFMRQATVKRQRLS